MNSCAVTIPVYKPELTTQEFANVVASISNLQGFDIYLFAPESLDLHYYESSFGLTKVVRFPDIYFDSIQGYSRLLLSDLFYVSFEAYSHVLICQPDARVLKPELGYWIDQPYDYLGAPWPKGFELTLYPKEIDIPEGIKCKSFIGNGGFSLRNIQSCLSLFNEFNSLREEWIQYGHSEDLFFGFASTLSRQFRIPNLMISACFSHETEPEYLYKLIGNQIPFGCHAHELHATQHWEIVMNIKMKHEKSISSKKINLISVNDEIRIKNNPRFETKDSAGTPNGFLVPIYNVHDGFHESGKEPNQVYLTVISKGKIKGPHLHFIRTGCFTCIKGNARFVLKTTAGYEVIYSGEEHSYQSVIVPTGIPAAIQNIGDEDAFVLNMPNPAWTPDMNDEHAADFSDFDFDFSSK